MSCKKNVPVPTPIYITKSNLETTTAPAPQLENEVVQRSIHVRLEYYRHTERLICVNNSFINVCTILQFVPVRGGIDFVPRCMDADAGVGQSHGTTFDHVTQINASSAVRYTGRL